MDKCPPLWPPAHRASGPEGKEGWGEIFIPIKSGSMMDFLITLDCSIKILYIGVHRCTWRLINMKVVTFTEFRQNAATYFDVVEKGETVRVLRHGKPIAEVVPAPVEEGMVSWKKPGLKLSIKGVSLSREILRERKQSKR